MAWSAPPRTWVTGEIVTAAIMNAHVRDQLIYLKGGAGTIAFDAAATFAGAITATDGTFSGGVNAASLGVGVAPSASYIGYFKGGTLPLRVEQSGSANSAIELRNTSLDATNKWALRIRAVAEGDFALYDMTAGTHPLYINSTGKVGLGTTAPKGVLHTYDTISGMMKWEFDGLAGVAQTIIPDGAGDVLYGLTIASITRSSGGTVQVNNALGTHAAPGGTHNCFNNGADQVVLTVAANGSVTIVRTGGTLTYKISILLIWL